MATWFLLTGQDTNVKNSATSVSLLTIGSDARFYTTEEVNQFDNSGPSASAKAFPLLEDAILEYFEGYESGHVIGVGTDLEMETWTQTFFENRIHLSGISLRAVLNIIEPKKLSKYHILKPIKVKKIQCLMSKLQNHYLYRFSKFGIRMNLKMLEKL